MKFALDTNAVTALLKKDEAFLRWVRQHSPRDISLPAIVIHELHYGALRSQRVTANLADIEALPFQALEFDAEDARASGVIRTHLERQGSPIGPYDLLIAGQAVARELTLVTRNAREFSRVPGLHLADWT